MTTAFLYCSILAKFDVYMVAELSCLIYNASVQLLETFLSSTYMTILIKILIAAYV